MEVFGELKNAYLEKDNAGKTALGAICCGDNITSEFDVTLTATPKVTVGNGAASVRLATTPELGSAVARINKLESDIAAASYYGQEYISPSFSILNPAYGSLDSGNTRLIKNATYSTVSLVGAVTIYNAVTVGSDLNGEFELFLSASSGPIRSDQLILPDTRVVKNDCGISSMTIALGQDGVNFSSIQCSPSFGSITTEYLKAQNGAEIGNTVKILITYSGGFPVSARAYYPATQTTYPLNGNTDTISVTATYRGPTDYREIIVGTWLTNAISMYSMVKRISGV